MLGHQANIVMLTEVTYINVNNYYKCRGHSLKPIQQHSMIQTKCNGSLIQLLTHIQIPVQKSSVDQKVLNLVFKLAQIIGGVYNQVKKE